MTPLRVALLAAAAGALLAMVDLAVAATAVGLVLVVLGTLIAAPLAPSGGWWNLLAIGAALTLTGTLLSQVAATIGGLITVAGGALVITGSTFGYR